MTAEDDDGDWPQPRRVPVAEVAPLKAPPAARSVFEMSSDALDRVARRSGLQGRSSATEPAVCVPRITRDESGVIRCERIPVQDTAEYHQAERARRARQKLPRQSGWTKMRLRSRKLLDIIGKPE